MKRIYIYIIVSLFTLTACEKETKTSYKDVPGLYFHYDPQQGSRNYQDDSLTYTFFGMGDERLRDTLWIDVRTMGFPENYPRAFKISQRNNENAPVAGEHYISFDNPEMNEFMKVPSGKVQFYLPVIITRTESMKTIEYRLELAIEENENFTIGIAKQSTFIVKFSAMAIKPTLWDTNWIWYFGEWGPVKMKFIMDYLGIKEFGSTTDMDTETGAYFRARAREELEKYVDRTGEELYEEDGTKVEFPMN